MYCAGRGDEFVGRVATEVQIGGDPLSTNPKMWVSRLSIGLPKLSSAEDVSRDFDLVPHTAYEVGRVSSVGQSKMIWIDSTTARILYLYQANPMR